MGFITKLLRLDRNDTAVVIGGDTIDLGVGVAGAPWKMPAYIAFEKARKRVLAVGEEAQKMHGREPDGIRAIRFTSHGGFGINFDLGEAAIRYALRSRLGSVFVTPRLIVICPDEQKNAMTNACIHAGAREVITIRPAMAAALGVGLKVEGPDNKAVFVLERDWCAFALIAHSNFVMEFELPFGTDALLEEVALHALATRNVALDLDALHTTFLTTGLSGGDLLGWEARLDELETGRTTSSSYSETDLSRGTLPFMLRLRWHYRQALATIDRTKAGNSSTAKLQLCSPYARLPGVLQLIGKAFLREVVVPDQGDTAMVRGGQVFLNNADDYRRVAALK